MAFPQIVDADTKNGTVASNSTSWTLTYPTNLASGDLIIALVATDGNPTVTLAGSGWFSVTPIDAINTGLSLYKKASVGTETGTFTATLSATEQGAWRIFRITGWEGTLGSSWTGSSAGAVTTDNVGPGVTGVSANPDPPAVNPANWDVEDTLWFAAIAVDTSRTISVYPLANRNTADVSGGAGGATLGVCTTTSAVASLDPGTFTISTSDDWAAATIAVRPAPAAAAANPPYTNPMPQLLAQ
jgi:hypothetical protein